VASRADGVALGGSPAAAVLDARPAPTLRGAIREALSDLYYHSWRLVPANIVWSITALGVLIAVALLPFGLIAIPVLGIPTAGLFRMSGRIARGNAVSFWDAAAAWRRGLGSTLALSTGLTIFALVLGVNTLTGVLTATMVGWAFATLAFWGLLATWLFAWTAWPLLCDPARERWPARERLRLAALLTLAHPVRLGAMGLLLLVLLFASTVAIVAVLTISVAIAALIAARFILPAADRLDARLGFAAARSLPEVAAADE